MTNPKAVKLKKVRAWAVVVHGEPNRSYVRRTKSLAIAAWMKCWDQRPANRWEYWKARGATCERVTITIDAPRRKR